MPVRRPKSVTLPTPEQAAEMVRRMRCEAADSSNYRSKSLRIHGSVCARCGREFTSSDLHLLTVHHRDGNHHNNPRDGSNWENLCSHCHDDLHSRGLLGEYLSS